MSEVATRIILQGRQWSMGEYGTQVTADHLTGKTLGASARQEASKGQFPSLFNSVHLTCTNHYVLCCPQKTRYNVPCETALKELTTWSRDLREKISVLGKQASMACPRMRTEERPPMAANILNNHSRTSEKGWSSSLSVGEVLTTPHRISLPCYKTSHKASNLWTPVYTSMCMCVCVCVCMNIYIYIYIYIYI